MKKIDHMSTEHKNPFNIRDINDPPDCCGMCKYYNYDSCCVSRKHIEECPFMDALQICDRFEREKELGVKTII